MQGCCNYGPWHALGIFVGHLQPRKLSNAYQSIIPQLQELIANGQFLFIQYPTSSYSFQGRAMVPGRRARPLTCHLRRRSPLQRSQSWRPRHLTGPKSSTKIRPDCFTRPVVMSVSCGTGASFNRLMAVDISRPNFVRRRRRRRCAVLTVLPVLGFGIPSHFKQPTP